MPVINKAIDDRVVNITEGDEVGTTLNCKTIKGTPEPNITWYDGNMKALVTDENSANLPLNKLTRGQDQTYTCVAKNSAGVDTKTVSVVVQCMCFKFCLSPY